MSFEVPLHCFLISCWYYLLFSFEIHTDKQLYSNGSPPFCKSVSVWVCVSECKKGKLFPWKTLRDWCEAITWSVHRWIFVRLVYNEKSSLIQQLFNIIFIKKYNKFKFFLSFITQLIT